MRYNLCFHPKSVKLVLNMNSMKLVLVLELLIMEKLKPLASCKVDEICSWIFFLILQVTELTSELQYFMEIVPQHKSVM